jgi:V8-like Glu-specific endopeptidase
VKKIAPTSRIEPASPPHTAVPSLFTWIILSSLIFTSFTSGCQQAQESSEADTSSIIGRDDSKWVVRRGGNQPAFITSAIDAIGKMEFNDDRADPKVSFIPPEPCTVYYIGNSRALTAGHCFQLTTKADRSIASGTPCKAFSILWGYLNGQTSGSGESNCVKIESHSWVQPEGAHQAQIDYAVIVIDKPPKASLKINQNYSSKGGEEIAVVGHSSGNPQKYSFCKTVSSPSDPWTKNGFIHHECDTTGGASGSPVFLRSTGEVIGIHTYGANPAQKERTNKYSPLKMVNIKL